MSETYLFTSESVSEGHPDKVCDQISDAILDAFLTRDPEARVAVETLVTKDLVVLAGEVRAKDALDSDEMSEVARQTIKKIGYDQPGFDWQTTPVQCHVHTQSDDIAQGVDAGNKGEEGAGDQGIMFGYACDETPELMPAPIQYAHAILKNMARDRHNGPLAGKIGPDAKSQVTLLYDTLTGKPIGVDAVVVSTQHHADLTQNDVRELITPYVDDVMPDDWRIPEGRLYINPTGRFVIGGPVSDAGLTGRKIIVDTYGGAAPHGGGAFSGKDPTKVDRSGAYIARYLAKNIVAAGLASHCLIQLSYAIGVPEPVSIALDTYGTSRVKSEKIVQRLRELVKLTPRGIRTRLGLERPIYGASAKYGHFGRTYQADTGRFSWENTDLIEPLKDLL